jgi:flagellar basal-body rod modification protein FlgD
VASYVSLPTSTNSASNSNASSNSSTSGTAPSKELFLQLLVAQIKNQDPLNPTDSMQFVSQLAQFSELEQIIAIRQGVDGLNTAATDTGNTDNTTSET